jgi:putative nucleotidyltransferase with HDIG domain
MYADKRQRPLVAGTAAVAGVIDDELAARLIGELVPLLASAATLDAKLGLIAQRLSQGTGYAGVTFDVFEQGAEGVQDRNTTLSTNAFAEAGEEMVNQWRDTQRAVLNHPISAVIREHMRPVIIDDVSTTPYVTEDQRTILKSACILSGIVLPLVWQGEWIGTMAVGSRELAAFAPRDARFLATVAGHASAIIQSERMVEELRLASDQLATSHGETVMLLASSVEAHDATTGRHLVRVRELTEALALELGCDAEVAHNLATASVLHDIGKVRVPDAVLKSPDKLSENEWLTMKQHTIWGAEFLASHSGFELAAEIARAHHERWDGSGYPHGLVGDAIPMSAQLVGVADAFDAMTSDRPYRMGRSPRSAVREVFTHSGTQFSPAVVAALLRLYRRGALPAAEQVHERVAA